MSLVSERSSAEPATEKALPEFPRSHDKTDRAAARLDRSGWLPAGLPDSVVHARTVGDVVAAVRYASQNGIPVVARGAGTGLAGGAAAGEGSIVIDLSALNHIVSIEAADGIARVEPGVITADLDRAAREHGLFYAPDPGSVDISTIGGNIATNAGGLRGAKYGVTRDAVLALDVVLADGSLITVGRETVKGVTGYDLTALFVGSEGTLGIVVGATLRLLPVPVAVSTTAAFFRSIEDAAEAASAVGLSGARPSVLEIVDGATLVAIDSLHGTTLATKGEAFLLAQTDGFGAALESAVVAEAIGPWALSVESTNDEVEAEKLLSARRLALPSIESLGPVLIEDIAVPRSRLAEAIRGVQRISALQGVRIFVFGHAGDGNLHPIIVIDDEPGADDRAALAAEAIFHLALDLGGTLTAEHGIGALKRDFVSNELGERVVELQHNLKALFDPRGILNPGKAL